MSRKSRGKKSRKIRSRKSRGIRSRKSRKIRSRKSREMSRGRSRGRRSRGRRSRRSRSRGRRSRSRRSRRKMSRRMLIRRSRGGVLSQEERERKLNDFLARTEGRRMELDLEASLREFLGDPDRRPAFKHGRKLKSKRERDERVQTMPTLPENMTGVVPQYSTGNDAKHRASIADMPLVSRLLQHGIINLNDYEGLSDDSGIGGMLITYIDKNTGKKQVLYEAKTVPGKWTFESETFYAKDGTVHSQ